MGLVGLLGLAGSGEGWNWCWVLWIISVFPPSAALGAEMVAVARGGWGEVPPFNCKLEISSAPGSQLIEASREAPDNTNISYYNWPGYYPAPILTILLRLRHWGWLDLLAVLRGQKVLVPTSRVLVLLVLLVSAPGPVHLPHSLLHHR